MLRSFLVLFICCVGLSVAQDFGLLGFPSFHQECGSNEVAMGCINPCPPEKTCQDRESYACLAVVVPCKFQCHCKEGLIRKTEGGECIPEDECECGMNEVLNNCVGCPPEDSCYDRDQILCPAAFLPCHSECVCKGGFIRTNLGGKCIPKEECGAPCKIFEGYTECKQCSNETCSSIVSPSKSNCASEKSCTPGCACWEGYYRADENSTCLYRCLCSELEDSPECVFRRTPMSRV